MGLYLLPLLFALMSCSLQKMAMRSATPLFEKSSDGMMKEGNWDFFKASAPGNIKFLELIYLQDPENLKLLAVLIKSYSGYAFAIPETLYFADEIEEREDSKWKADAIRFYTKSLDYGLYYLKQKDISREDLLSGNEKKLKEKLKEMDEEDLTAMLYFAQAWGSLINLQKDNVVLVSQVPKVKLLFDEVCSRKPDIDHNICDIFYAQYFASRPKMLGGDPEKGEEIFLKSMEKHPHNLLLRMSYLQYVVLPAYDQEKYEKISLEMKKEIALWEDMNRDELRNNSPYRKNPGLNLYNSIAKKRFLLVEKNKNKIF